MKVPAFAKERKLWILLVIGVMLMFILGMHDFKTKQDLFSVNGLLAFCLLGFFAISLLYLSKCFFYYFKVDENGIGFLYKNKLIWNIKWAEIAEIGLYSTKSWIANEGVKDYNFSYGETIYISKIPLPQNEIALILQLALICCLESEEMIAPNSSAGTERFDFLTRVIMREVGREKNKNSSFLAQMFEKPENMKILSEIKKYYVNHKAGRKHQKIFYQKLRKTDPLKNITLITAQKDVKKLIIKYCPFDLSDIKSYYDMQTESNMPDITFRNSPTLTKTSKMIRNIFAICSFILFGNGNLLAAMILLIVLRI